VRASALALQRVVALHTVQLAKRGSVVVDKGALLADMRKCVPAFTALKLLATTGDESGHGGASTGMGTMYKGHPDQKVLDALFGFSQIRAVARSRMPMDELPLRTVLAKVLQANGVKRTAQRALAALRLVPYPDKCDKVSDALNVIKNSELCGVLAPGARVSQQMVRGEYISPYMDDAAGPKVAVRISSDEATATTNVAGAQARPRVPKRERRRASLATVAESDEPVAASSNPVQNQDRLNSPMEQSSPPPLAAPVRLLNLTLNSPMEQSSPPPLAAPVRLLNFGGADLLAEAAEVAAAAGILSHIASDDDKAATLRAELLRAYLEHAREPPLLVETIVRAYDNCNSQQKGIKRIFDNVILNDVTAGVAVLPHAPIPAGLSSRRPEFLHVSQRRACTAHELGGGTPFDYRGTPNGLCKLVHQ
jgi:hypothetical protein